MAIWQYCAVCVFAGYNFLLLISLTWLSFLYFAFVFFSRSMFTIWHGFDTNDFPFLCQRMISGLSSKIWEILTNGRSNYKKNKYDENLLRNYSKFCFQLLYIFVKVFKLKEPGLIASDFFQTFWDFGIGRKFIFFLLPLVNFTHEKCTVWKILMKMWLVMVMIIKLTQ